MRRFAGGAQQECKLRSLKWPLKMRTATERDGGAKKKTIASRGMCIFIIQSTYYDDPQQANLILMVEPA